MKKLVLCLFTLLSIGSAQVVSLGVRGGVPLTDFLEAAQGNESAYFTNTKRYTIGPTVEFHLPLRFGIGVDALYKRVGYEGTTTGTTTSSTSTTANSWEFPIYGKLEILPGPIRPFLDAGVSIRHITGISQVRSVFSAATLNTVEIDNPPEFNKETDVGFVFGGGIALKISRVRISPEFRYTRWGGENFRDPINALLRTNRNQGEFLLGLTF